MKKCHKMILIAFWLLYCNPSAIAYPAMKFLQEQAYSQRYESIERAIGASKDNISIDTLARIGKEIEVFPIGSKTSSQWKYWRRAKLDLWLQAIDIIDRIKDPSFNPKDVPEINVAPPKGVKVAAAGMDASAIKDPELRRQYEKAIELNKLKAENYARQNAIRRLDAEWTEKIKDYITMQYTTSLQDQAEIKDLTDRRLSLEKRKTQIREFLKGFNFE